MLGGIVVRKSDQSAATPAAVTPDAKLVILCRSRGALTDSTASITRDGTSGDPLLSSMNTPLREIVSAVKSIVYAGYGTDTHTWYPNVHFLVKQNTTVLDPSNIIGENISDLTTVSLDWSIAPLIKTPGSLSYTLDTEGSVSAGTYYYKVSAVNLNDEESIASSTLTVVVSSDNSKVKISWSACQYVKGYKVYKSTDGTTWKLLATLSYGMGYTYYTDDGTVTGTTATPPSSSSAKEVPAGGSTYTLNYRYGDVTYDTPTEYTSVADVVADHGVGSDAANIAEICLSRSLNGASAITIVVPSSYDYAGFKAALDSLEGTEGPLLIVPIYYNLTFFDALNSHCESKSDPVTGQMERRGVVAALGGTSLGEVTTLATRWASSSENGNRMMWIYPEGGEVRVSSWQGYDGEYNTDYTVEDPSGNDITPSVLAAACIARYLSLGDLTMPLTEKDVKGFSFAGVSESPYLIKQAVENYGVVVVANRSGTPVVERSIFTGLPVTSLEEAEMNIVVWEDWMKKDMRTLLREFRGKKMIGSVLSRVKRKVKSKLGQYKANNWIVDFEENSIVVGNSTTYPDKVSVTFTYGPVYPINYVDAVYTQKTFTVVV